MTKVELRNISPRGSQSINVSVYRPSGLAGFFSWFSRRNKNNLSDLLEKADNFDLKLKVDNLKTLKMNGIDLAKLQNNKLGKYKGTFKGPNNNSWSNDNEFFNGIGIQNLTRKENVIKTTKLYEKKMKSTSSISIKSRMNFVNRNVKYTRNITSQRSTVNSVTSINCKTRLKDNNIKGTESNPLNRSVLLKSVPTAILKSNTQKKVFVPLYVGKRKPEKLNKMQNSKLPGSTETQDNDTSVIPMILTKMKSMEEQLCDIDNTTRKINEVVSQNSVVRINSMQKNLNPVHRHGQSMSKGMPTHKVYSRNIHTSKKSKLLTHKKLKNKSKLTVPTTFYDYTQCRDMQFETLLSDNHNAKEPINGKQDCNKFKFPINTQFFSIGDEANNEVLGGNQKTDYNIIYNLLKGLSVENNNEIIQPNKDNIKKQDFTSENVIIDANCFMSKPTFDWKHKSLSSASEKENDLIFNNKKPHSLAGAKEMVGNKKVDSTNKNNLNTPRRQVLKNKDILGNNNIKKELNIELTGKNEFVKERKEKEIKIVKPLYTDNNLKVQIFGEKCTEEDYSLKLCQDIIKSLEDQNGFVTEQNSKNEEFQSNNSVCKSNNKQQISNKAQTINYSGDGQHHIDKNSKDIPQMKDDPKNNEKSKMKKVGGKKMVTRATQSDPDPNEGVKVCVETSSGDKVKIENSSCGAGLTIVTSGGVSLVQANGPSHKDNVKICDKEDKNNNTVLPKNVNISTEIIKKEDMKLISQQLSSISKDHLNKEGHFYKGIDKFVPPKQIESDNCAFRFQGQYMSQEKRKTYEEFLKKGSRLNQRTSETIQRPHLVEEINQVTSYEDPMRKSVNTLSVINSYLTRQEANNSRSSISLVDTLVQPKIMQLSSSCGEKTRQSFEREVEYGGEKSSKLEKPVRNIKKYNFSGINLFKDLPIGKQPFLTVLNEKDEVHSNTFDSPLATLELKKRSCRNGFTIQEPIAEEASEDIIVVNSASDPQSEKGDHINIKSLGECRCSEILNVDKIDNSESENKCKVFSAQLQNAETPFKYFNDLSFFKTSVSVQTDWSLVGITVDHFKNYQSNGKCRTTVSSQTEITMEQLSISEAGNTTIPIICGPCAIKSNVNEKGKLFTNCNSLCSTIEEEKQNSNDEKIPNVVTITTAEVHVENNTQETVTDRIKYLNDHAVKQPEATCVKNCINVLPELKCNEHQIDFKPRHYNALEQNHECCIPCFLSLSEETLLSDMSDLNYDQMKPTELKNSALSEIYKNSILSSFSINNEVISINNYSNISKIKDAEKESSLKSNVLFQTPPKPEAHEIFFRNQNNTETGYGLPSAADDSEYKSHIGMVPSSNANNEIQVTADGEICSPSKPSGQYRCDIFQKNISTKTSTERNNNEHSEMGLLNMYYTKKFHC